MQQRRPRLGDILDDYCPRERRITNHAVVAMIEDEVKQTRCTTCDSDHEYKQAKLPSPRRRKPDAAGAGEVEGTLRPRPVVEDVDDEVRDEPQDDQMVPGESFEVPLSAAAQDLNHDSDNDTDAETDVDADGDDRQPSDDDGPVHRRLIRATLPRQEGQVPERKAPDFTVRQPGGRGGREFDGNKPGNRPGGPGGRGRRPMRAQGGPPGQPPRFGGAGGGGPRHGSGQGQRPPGNRPGHPGANRGGGRPPGGQGRGPGGGGGRKRGR